MNKSTLFVGIDVSKDSFDVYDPDKGYSKFKNSTEGFKLFKKEIGSSAWCVMEATGSYHQQLAVYLYEQGVSLSVVNPLIIKRFIQMKLKRVKADKSDARMIADFGKDQAQVQWTPPKKYVEESNQITSILQMYLKQNTSLKNMLHSLKSKGVNKGLVVRSVTQQLRKLQAEIKKLERSLEEIIKANEPDLLTRLTSITGVGKKTAILLIVNTEGFKKFASYKQIISYFGLAPIERS